MITGNAIISKIGNDNRKINKIQLTMEKMENPKVNFLNPFWQGFHNQPNGQMHNKGFKIN